MRLLDYVVFIHSVIPKLCTHLSTDIFSSLYFFILVFLKYLCNKNEKGKNHRDEKADC